MGIEEDFTRKVSGARASPNTGGSQTACPLYDGYGNMIATLTKGPGGTFTVSLRQLRSRKR